MCPEGFLLTAAVNLNPFFLIVNPFKDVRNLFLKKVKAMPPLPRIFQGSDNYSYGRQKFTQLTDELSFERGCNKNQN